MTGVQTCALPIWQEKEDRTPDDVAALVEARTEAKKNRDFARADELRAKILGLGYTIMDTPQGPKVSKA